MTSRRCNLVFVLWDEQHARTRADLTEIAEHVERINPLIRTFVVAHHKLDELRLLPTWSVPTLSLSFLDLAKPKLLPGRLVTGVLLFKHGEYARLDAAGIAVPQWTVIAPDTRLDPEDWGPYVVEKPAAGRRGSYVRVRKTTRVRYAPPESIRRTITAATGRCSHSASSIPASGRRAIASSRSSAKCCFAIARPRASAALRSRGHGDSATPVGSASFPTPRP